MCIAHVHYLSWNEGKITHADKQYSRQTTQTRHSTQSGHIVVRRPRKPDIHRVIPGCPALSTGMVG